MFFLNILKYRFISLSKIHCGSDLTHLDLENCFVKVAGTVTFAKSSDEYLQSLFIVWPICFGTHSS